MQTRSRYIKQLEALRDDVSALARKAADDVAATSRALAGDVQAADDILSGGKAAHRLRSGIEEGCLNIMLMQQPLIGDDLRLVTGAFRAVSDLSHIDGMARDVAELALQLPECDVAGMIVQLEEACSKVAFMVETAVEAFLQADRDLAAKVFAADDEVDALYSQCTSAVVGLIRAGSGAAEHLPELLMVAKYYERMADDAERVANWAVFRVTGEHEVKSREE